MLVVHARDRRDYICATDLRSYLSEETLLWLITMSHGVALNGEACWSATEVGDLLALRELEREAS